MSQAIAFETHASNLGRLVGNLQSIEMGARITIAKHDSRPGKQSPVSLPEVQTGDWVEISPLTDTNDLRNTLDRYNKFATAECRVDVDRIVELRDALAHGRTFGHGPHQSVSNLRLVKFGKEKKGNRVEVKMALEMTETSFRENIEFLWANLQKIIAGMEYESQELTPPA